MYWRKKHKGVMQNPAVCGSNSESVADSFSEEFKGPDSIADKGSAKKRRTFAIVAAMLAVMLLTTTLSTALLSTSVKAAVYGPKFYYLSIEKQNLKDYLNNFKEDYIEKYQSEYSYDVTATAKMTGDFISTDDSLKLAADCLSGMEINARYNANTKDLEDQYYTASFTANLKGSSLGGIDVKSADNKALISFPGLSEKNIGMEVSKESNKYLKAFLDDDEAFEEIFGISRKTFDKLVEKYFRNVIFNAIPNNKVSFNKSAVFQNNKCNSIVFKIDDKVIAGIYTALAKEIAKDKDLKTFLQSGMKSFGSYVEELGNAYTDMPEISDIDQDIKDICNNLNDAAKDVKGINMTYTVYFENDGDILSRNLTSGAKKDSVNLASYTDKSGNDIVSFYYDKGGKKIIDFSNEQKLDNGSYKGKFNLGVLGGQVLNGEYTQEKDARVGGLDAYVGEVKGSIKVQELVNRFYGYMLGYTSYNDMDASDSLYDDGDEYYDSEEILDDVIDDINFSYTSKRLGSDTLLGEVNVLTKIGGKSLNFSANTKLKQSDKANIAKPTVSLDNSISMTDIDEMQDLGEDIGFNLITKILKVMPDIQNQMYELY
jgi:hypothetical protein